MALNPTVITISDIELFEAERFEEQDLLIGLNKVRSIIAGRDKLLGIVYVAVFPRNDDCRGNVRSGLMLTKTGREVRQVKVTVTGNIKHDEILRIM